VTQFGIRELLIVAAVLGLLFGAKKIPQLARGIGEGIREFKRARRDAA
jgi:sec-independent protein translocase protein TatA